MKKIIKKVLKVLGVLILVLLVIVAIKFWRDTANPYDNTIAKELIPTFKAIDLPFTQEYVGSESLPLTASALIDIDNDGVDEVFFGGGLNQQDDIFAFKGDKFESISNQVNLPQKNNLTTLGVASTDFDQNGFTDLIVSREDGLTIYYNSNGKFTAKKVDYPLADNATPLGLTLGDVNKDGYVDIFVSNYIRKHQMIGQNNFSENYGPTSQLLINNLSST